MPRHARLLALACLGLAFATFSPRPVPAANFTQSWSRAGWNLRSNLGNLDGDSQPELLFSSKADDHFAIVDGLTGAIQQEFPQFLYTNSTCTAVDIDGDGKPEVLFDRFVGGSPLATAYHWNGASWVSVLSTTDPMDSGWGPAHLRSASFFDMLEVAPNDVRVRDLAGTVVFRASTAIPGWVGTQPAAILVDIDHDGIPELLVMDVPNKAWMFKYTGAFTPLWSETGWMIQGDLNLDGDPQPEFVSFNVGDGRYGLIDALTGVVQNDFPDFTLFDNSSFVPLDLDGDGRPELLLQRPASSTVTPLFLALHWNGARYDTLFTDTDRIDNWEPVHTRSTAQTEILELATVGAGEVRLRDTAGHVLFKASTGIAGWTGTTAAQTIPLDLDGTGIANVLMPDGGTLRLLKYGGGAYSQAWAANGWNFAGDVGNTDGDPEHELMLYRASDGRFGRFDALTGADKQEFPSFTYPSAVFQAGDVDGDGRTDLFFYRPGGLGQPSLSTGYKWNGSSFAATFTHTDTLQGVEIDHLRRASMSELLESSYSDVRLRDPLTGAVLFKASSDLPGWAGLDMSASDVIDKLDFDADGVPELVLTDLAAVRFLKYTGTAGVPGLAEHLAFRVFPSAPNPFRTATTFRFSLPRAGDVAVRIFDTAGRLVRRLDRSLPAGMQQITWDGRDDAGQLAPSGVLFYEIRADGFRQTSKVVRTQ